MLLLMPIRRLALLACILTPLACSAQLSMNFRSEGLNFATPGIPFQAERITHSTQTLPDGNTIVRAEHEILARDNDGRLYDESQALAPDGTPATGATVLHVIIDPVAKRILQWNSKSKSVLSQVLPPNVRVTLTTLPARRDQSTGVPKDKLITKTEDLGGKTIAGIEVIGLHVTVTLPAGTIGNSKDLVYTRDVWFSKNMQMNMSESDSSPFDGPRSAEITTFKQEAPPDTLFQPPADLPITQQTNTVQAMINKSTAPANTVPPEYTVAMQDIHDPEKQEAAAQVLLAYVKTHEDMQNNVAYALASAGIHLDEANDLSQQSIQRVETATAAIDIDHVAQADLNRMNALASHWDTLGWIRHRQNNDDAARSYCRLSWELGGRGAGLDHLAQIARKENDLPAARHLLQVAMSGQLDDNEKVRNGIDLKDLGVDKPVAIAEPELIKISGFTPVSGSSANFYLLFVAHARPQVRWQSGDGRLSPAERAISSATFAPQMPDDGPEHILRRAQLNCTASDCTLTMLYSWQTWPGNLPVLAPSPVLPPKP